MFAVGSWKCRGAAHRAMGFAVSNPFGNAPKMSADTMIDSHPSQADSPLRPDRHQLFDHPIRIRSAVDAIRSLQAAR